MAFRRWYVRMCCLKSWGTVFPCAVWHDVAVIAPWTLYEETGDSEVLKDQYESMVAWLGSIPKEEGTQLWDLDSLQLGDWLDPNAPPDEPQKANTDAVLVANAFLIYSLDLTARTAVILQKSSDASQYKVMAESARDDFAAEYITPKGRLASDSQTAYALAICFNLLSPAQLPHAGDRLADIVRRNAFRVGTGFAGTPFVCEALTLTGHSDVAYAILLNETCPSWLYPITMGATTMWERWDSMLPDGAINPGEMTSFNHYAYGAVAKFMVERLAGLQRVDTAWKKSRCEPVIGGPFKWAKAEHLTPYGKISSSWALSERETENGAKGLVVEVVVVVPPTTEMEVALPGSGKTQLVGSGEWSFTVPFKKKGEWPVKTIGFWDALAGR